MSRPPEEGITERIPCNGNWPGFLMWDMSYQQSKFLREYCMPETICYLSTAIRKVLYLFPSTKLVPLEAR